jgi:hypothetical protein
VTAVFWARSISSLFQASQRLRLNAELEKKYSRWFRASSQRPLIRSRMTALMPLTGGLGCDGLAAHFA